MPLPSKATGGVQSPGPATFRSFFCRRAPRAAETGPTQPTNRHRNTTNTPSTTTATPNAGARGAGSAPRRSSRPVIFKRHLAGQTTARCSNERSRSVRGIGRYVLLPPPRHARRCRDSRVLIHSQPRPFLSPSASLLASQAPSSCSASRPAQRCSIQLQCQPACPALLTLDSRSLSDSACSFTTGCAAGPTPSLACHRPRWWQGTCDLDKSELGLNDMETQDMFERGNSESGIFGGTEAADNDLSVTGDLPWDVDCSRSTSRGLLAI